MTENNTNDRRFWMVIAETNTGDFICLSDKYDEFIEEFMVDSDKADILAKKSAIRPEYKNVYVLEAASRYSVPEPRVVKQNLHIPPLTPRGESNE